MTNLYSGDCLEILKSLESGSVNLVYLDPPFFTGKTHTQKTRDNGQEYKFDDKWNNLEAYLNFLEERIKECKRVLNISGSIFLHCDKNASHNLRILMDKIFGEDNFINEIIWTYKRWSNSKKGLMSNHQTIFFYSKSKKFKFNQIYTDYSPTTNIDQILQARARNPHNKSIYKRDENGEIVLGKEKKGVPLSDVWDIPYLNPKAQERVGYPTQKPILLLEKIINIATDANDVVLDPFCGSGTTLVAAKLLNRSYIGIDISSEAIALSEKRLNELKKTESTRLQKGLASYLNKEDYVRQILIQLDAVVAERNKGIDGFLKKHYKGKPVAIYVQRKNQTLQEALSIINSAARSKGIDNIILVRTNDINKHFGDVKPDVNKDVLVLDSLDFQMYNKFNLHL